MYELIPAKVSKGTPCDKCRHGSTAFVFMGVRYNRWQKRCRRCAERMVRDGKAKMTLGEKGCDSTSST